MAEVFLARWQFGLTSTYHFLFVPLTLGLSILVAIMETQYVRTGNPVYRQLTKFWGKLFLVNFSMGVVTGIVQEFHFGMNWSEYSRFMGDIFGAPLAMEALSAFFLESTFIGLWIFGWERLSKKAHMICIWIVAFASNLSAFWILAANSFMQAPLGYTINNGRAEMIDFGAVITNRYLISQFPHTVLSGLVTAGVFITAISAYYLLRKRNLDIFRESFKIGVICTLIAGALVMGAGHIQTQYIAKVQPMKLAAIEALWETANPAPFTIVATIDEAKQKNGMEVEVPGLLTILAYDSLQGEVKGIKDLQASYIKQYGPGSYIPEVTPLFWSFKLMIVAGLWVMFLAALSGFLFYKGRLEENPLILKALLWSLPAPYIANSCGWFVAEAGRQPWLVFGLQKVAQGVSPNVSSAMIWTSMIGFTLLYAILAVAAVYLVVKFIKAGPDQEQPIKVAKTKEATLWN